MKVMKVATKNIKTEILVQAGEGYRLSCMTIWDYSFSHGDNTVAQQM